jgi:hypothetical protein
MAEQQEEYGYGLNPASTVSININLTELPKCKCGGVLLPLSGTSNPKSGCYTVICYGWTCIECNKNVMFTNGKIQSQPIIQETNAL